MNKKKTILLSFALLALVSGLSGCSKRCKCVHIGPNDQVLSVTYHEVSGLNASCSSLTTGNENYGDEGVETGIIRVCESDE